MSKRKTPTLPIGQGRSPVAKAKPSTRASRRKAHARQAAYAKLRRAREANTEPKPIRNGTAHGKALVAEAQKQAPVRKPAGTYRADNIERVYRIERPKYGNGITPQPRIESATTSPRLPWGAECQHQGTHEMKRN